MADIEEATQRLISNERIKLTATWLNGMASGVIVTGIVAPAIAVAFHVVTAVSIGVVLASSAIWLSSAVGPHLYARQLLGSIRA